MNDQPKTNSSLDTKPGTKAESQGLSGYQDGLTLGIQMAVGMAFFTGLGYWLDLRRGGGRFFTLCGMFLGLLYGFYEVWKLIRKLRRNNPGRKDLRSDGADCGR